jgi:hypothetical protein
MGLTGVFVYGKRQQESAKDTGHLVKGWVPVLSARAAADNVLTNGDGFGTYFYEEAVPQQAGNGETFYDEAASEQPGDSAPFYEDPDADPQQAGNDESFYDEAASEQCGDGAPFYADAVPQQAGNGESFYEEAASEQLRNGRSFYDEAEYLSPRQADYVEAAAISKGRVLGTPGMEAVYATPTGHYDDIGEFAAACTFHEASEQPEVLHDARTTGVYADYEEMDGGAPATMEQQLHRVDASESDKLDTYSADWAQTQLDNIVYDEQSAFQDLSLSK